MNAFARFTVHRRLGANDPLRVRMELRERSAEKVVFDIELEEELGGLHH